MADISDAKANINDVEVDADAGLSEALFEKMGGAINYLNTTTDTHTTELTSLKGTSLDSSKANISTNPAGTTETTIVSQSVTVSNSKVLILLTSWENSTNFQSATYDALDFENRPASPFIIVSNASGSNNVTLRLKRDSTGLISETEADSGSAFFVHGPFSYIDDPGDGTYTYSITYQYAAIGSGSPVIAAGLKMVCINLPTEL